MSRSGARTIGSAGLIVAVIVTALGAPAIASNGTGNYGAWQVSGKTGTLPPVSGGLLGAGVSSSANVSTSSGSSAWLPAWTPFGEVFGSSQNQKYMSVPVASGNGTSLTISFDFPTPRSGWGFALGDVDAEQVAISAVTDSGTSVAVNPWFSGVFNYCEQTPRSSTCGGSDTDVPSWNGTTLVGSGTDTKGASGWFRPTVSLSSITFTATRLTGIPEFQIWLAADKSFTASDFAPVSLIADPPTVPANKPVVELSGTTAGKHEQVIIYRAPGVGKPATPVRIVTSKNRKFRAKRVPVGHRQSVVFCARTSRGVSNPVIVHAASKSRTSRGDVVTCPRRGTR